MPAQRGSPGNSLTGSVWTGGKGKKNGFGRNGSLSILVLIYEHIIRLLVGFNVIQDH